MGQINKHAVGVLNSEAGSPIALVVHVGSTVPSIGNWSLLTHYRPSQSGSDLELLIDEEVEHTLSGVALALVQAHALSLPFYAVDGDSSVIGSMAPAPSSHAA
ncbi:hypothetical protein LCGC14_0328270 [marine sediment metagenome]|uniref:Uncharacterized protein n=1 Tax=marine sediment metagenome TaxID=412755 RepID=A0A0F9WPG5_9ZZZZ